MEENSSTHISFSMLIGVLVIILTTCVWIAYSLTSKPDLTTKKKINVSNHGPFQRSDVAQKVLKNLKKPSKIHHHHELCLNTLKGHGDEVSGIVFSSDGLELASACADGVVRVFHSEDVSSKSFRFFRINLPTGQIPGRVAFAPFPSTVAVTCRNASSEGSLLLYGPGAPKQKDASGKLPPPELKWEQRSAHGKQGILTLVSAPVGQGGLFATCSEGTDIKLWTLEGKCAATVDTNQLRNTMAALSPDGRFLAAAAFTADVKIWELHYDKVGSFQSAARVMQLNGHKSAVTWLGFSADSRQVVTASKDGTVKVWNIDVRYQVNEDTKCVRTFAVSSLGSEALKAPPQYDIIAISPDNSLLAASGHRAIVWHSLQSGEVLDTVHNAHEGEITALAWAPKLKETGSGLAHVLASSSTDKKVKLWREPRRQE